MLLKQKIFLSIWLSFIIVFSYYSMSQTSSKDSHLSQDAYFKCTHKCLLFNWIILILSYTLIGYLIADIHIYKVLIYPICEGIYYTDRISDLYMPYWVQWNKLLPIEIEKHIHENLSDLWRNLLYRLDIQSLFLYIVSNQTSTLE